MIQGPVIWEPAVYNFPALLSDDNLEIGFDSSVGSGVMVTSAKGGSDDSITAITLLAKADLLLKMMQPAGTHAGNADVEAMRRMHGISGSNAPTVMTMPAFVQ